MNYSKMKKAVAVIGAAAVLACSNGAFTVMAEESGVKAETAEKMAGAIEIAWDTTTGTGTFINPNSFQCGWCATLYKDGKAYGNYGYYNSKNDYYSWGVNAGETGQIDLFNMIKENGSYQFTVTLINKQGEAVTSGKSDVWNYAKQPGLLVPTVQKAADGVVYCELPDEMPLLHFSYQVAKGSNKETVKEWGGSHDVAQNSNSETMDCIHTPYGNVSVDSKYDYYVRVRAMSSDLGKYSESAYSDWVKILDAKNSSNNNNNNNASQKDITPEDMARYSVAGNESVKYTSNSAYSVEIKNSIQGPKCFDAFNAVLGDYTIGRTYNILPSGKYTYHMDSKAVITLTIPKTLQAADRDYKMICVTENGQPVELADIDSDTNTITFETDTYYAFALIYKDKALNQ